MQTPGWDKIVGLLMSFALLVGCSGSESEPASSADDPATEPAPTAGTVEEQCKAGAVRVADRLEAFLADFDSMTPEEFLSLEEIPGLTRFQNDVATLISETANQSSTLCDLNGLQGFVDQELDRVSEQGLLASFVVSTIRFGGTLEVADVALGPDDDLAAVMSLLDSGSSITLSEGTFEIDVSLLVQRELVLIGAGTNDTVIQSSAPDAAMAVFGEALLTMRDITVEHVGDEPASVILAFGAPVDLERVILAGAVSDDETAGGNGLLLSSGEVTDEGVTADATSQAQPPADSRIVASTIRDNSIAGIAVTGNLTPLIAGTAIVDNGLCGVCFLGESGGQVTGNSFEGNEFGIQMGDASSPVVTNNTARDNTVVGMVLLGSTTATIIDNTVVANGEVGIAVQEASSARIEDNLIERHPFGVTLVGTSTSSLTGNEIRGSEVALQVAEQANPVVTNNDLLATTNIGVLHRDTSTGTFRGNVVRGEQAVAVLVEGDAAPAISDVATDGSEVSVSYRERGAGTLTNSLFEQPSIAIQVEDMAAPEITNNTIVRPEAAGIVVRSSGLVVVRDNTIDQPQTLGIGTAGDARARIESNIVRGGESAASIIEQSTPEFVGNTFEGQVVAIQIGDQAAPILRDNEIVGATGAGIVYRDDAAGEARSNRVLNPVAVGIQVVDQAAPLLVENVVVADLEMGESGDQNGGSDATDSESENGASDAAESGSNDPADGASDAAENGVESGSENGASDATESGSNDPADGAESGSENDPENGAGSGSEIDPAEGAEDGADDAESTVGILYAGDGRGELRGNQILGFVIGIQASENARPNLVENTVDGGQTAGVGFLFRDTASGAATGNRTAAHSIGFQVSDTASPELTDNTVERAIDVSFLIQGSGTPRLAGNTCAPGVPGIGVLESAAPIIDENTCQIAPG